MKLIIYLFLLLFSTSLKAQEPYSFHYNQSIGLPSNSVYNIFQDSKGFIWFATNSGLTRYDGVEYKIYKSDFQTSTSGSCIQEDKFGRIWYENFDGYLYYTIPNNDSLFALNQNNSIGFANFAVTQKHILIMQPEGIDIFDIQSLIKIKTIPLTFKFFEHSISIDQNFYFILNHVIYKIDSNLKITTQDLLINNQEQTLQIYADNNNKRVYVCSKLNENKQIYFFNLNLKYLNAFSIPEPKFIQGSQIIAENIWIHTPTGSIVYDQNNANSKPITYFKEQSISNILNDRQKNYWFATTNQGLFLVPNLNHKIYTYPQYLFNKILKKDNEFIISTKKAQIFLFNNKIELTEKMIEEPSKNEVLFLDYDSTKQKLFYASNSFSVFDLKKKQNILNYNLALKDICKIDEDFYAFASSGSCSFFTFQPNKSSIWYPLFIKFPSPLIENMSYIKGGVRGKTIAYSTENQSIYYSDNSGLFKLTTKKNEEIRKNNQSFFANKIIIYKDICFLLSTKGDLYKLTLDNKFEYLNPLFQIPSYEVKKIKKSNNYLFVIGKKYIYSLNLDNQKITTLDFNISNLEINDIELNKNNLIILNNSNIISIPLNEIKPKERAIIQVNSFKVNDEIIYNPLEYNQLKYNQNNISLHFSILDFDKTEPDSIFYRLNEGNWEYIPLEMRTLQFPSLAPNSYKVEFKVNSEIISKKINFTIITPFWLKWWFITLCFLPVAFLIYSFFKWQNTLLKNQIVLLNEKMKLEESLSKSTLTSIKSQMNPHFLYNALNTIQAYILTNDKKNASTFLSKFSKLTRMILEMSEKDLVILNEEIIALTLYLELEKQRFEDNFSFNFNIDTNLSSDLIKIPPMLIQPFIENSIKHGLLHKIGNKTLEISFLKQNINLKVVIKDNGIGRSRADLLNKHKNENHNSFASHATQRRIELLNKNKKNKIELNIIDLIGNNQTILGTQVEILIPIYE